MTERDAGRRFDPERLLAMEERRRTLIEPETILRWFVGPRREGVFLDVGCGPGFFALAAAQLLPDGTVLAVDREEAMLTVLQRRVRELGQRNVVTLCAEAEALPLPDAEADWALLAFVLHDLEKPQAALRELRRVLKPGASLLVLEWQPVESAFGPPVEIRIGLQEVLAKLQAAGFTASSEDADGTVKDPVYAVIARREAGS